MEALKYGDWVKCNEGKVWVVGIHIVHKDLFNIERLTEKGVLSAWETSNRLTKLPEPICKILSDSMLSFNDKFYFFKEIHNVKNK
jgi:hypothetical protein